MDLAEKHSFLPWLYWDFPDACSRCPEPMNVVAAKGQAPFD